MSTASLELQSAFYEKMASDEGWKTDHENAMRCRFIEDVIAIGLTILGNLRRWRSAILEDIESGSLAFSWEEISDVDNQFRGWLNTSQGVLRAIRDCEAQGYRVNGGAQFGEEIVTVSLMPIDTESNRKSIESVEAGNARPHAEVMDDLRNRVRNRSH